MSVGDCIYVQKTLKQNLIKILKLQMAWHGFKDGGSVSEHYGQLGCWESNSGIQN